MQFSGGNPDKTMNIEELEKLNRNDLEDIASSWNGEDDEFIWEGKVYDSVVAENAGHLLSNMEE